MRIRTDRLVGSLLDYWVSRAEGRVPQNFSLPIVDGMFTRYSSNWDDAGPIIERERITIAAVGNRRKTWFAEISSMGFDSGVEVGYGEFQTEDDEPLVAAMRVYVMSKFGSEVDVMPVE